MIIIVIALTFIFVSWFLLVCVNKRIDRRDEGLNIGKIYAYIADNKLNLLRMALEGRGYNKWVERMSDIPVKEEAEGKFMPVQKEGMTLIYKIRFESSRREGHETLNSSERPADGDANNGFARSNASLHEGRRGINGDGDNRFELDKILKQN